jgi:hypothetical protein
MMTFSEYVTKRNAYSYPTVGLHGSIDRWTEVPFTTTHQLDCHQNHLLLSDENEEVILGYLSTIFWGYYSGKNNAKHSDRALAKVRLAYDGVKDIGVDSVAQEIRATFDKLKSNQYDEALRRLCHLPQLGIPFASKVCAFLIPTNCGVIDRVIANSYPCFGFSVYNNGYVKNNADNKLNYAAYCSFLQKQADTLNSQGEPFQWRDRDGLRYPWRAVDIERALY